ncbi:ABC-F family ATP-binding cassette domain-containing protein [Paenibacillus sp. UNC499MF]|uniref:ABC-F family ATP-binding cassette domain-containing protein n=1 Tax=Paenibacillus sp. UNC499MF TaxID=1502751 RepID=UPI00089FD311|nr:ABC-F family ATP-binding cassette domain-containing protein [Paenibacillus sp. UNC499MF]SEG75061.1 ATPase components of ABC transporters with duplicated ATPase domains [Paenibacillus sp. UNC499MF]
MSLLEITGMSHSFGDRTLYKGVDFELFKGEHLGIVGQNGTGKSTLLGILTGEIIPDEGVVRWQPNVRIGYLDQYAVIDGNLTVMEYLKTAFAPLYELEMKMNALYEESAVTGKEELLLKAARCQEELERQDFYGVDSTIGKIVNGLGLSAIGTERPIHEWSGGQRAKAILAKLLLEKPDVLLLDEPTNFLDKEHIGWLTDYLMSLTNAFVVISHDSAFLDKITTCICDIEGETIKKYPGQYSDFIRQKQHLREEHIRRYNAQQKTIQRTEEYIRKNMAGVNSRIARGRKKQLDKIERIAAPAFVSKPSIRFREMPLGAQEALRVNGLEVGYGVPLLPKLTFSVRNGEKVVITGFNGIGKSTLLKTLTGKIPSISGEFRFAEPVRTGYYEQDLVWENDTLTPVQYMSDCYPQLTNREIRRHLAQCGVNETKASQSLSTLSGGEQSKVKLCRLQLSPCNVLLMDEPTNHLDAEAKDALRSALIHLGGSLILVSHEHEFYEGWVDRVLEIGNLKR